MHEQCGDNDLHCIQYLPRMRLEDGGIVRFVLDLCAVLANHGTTITLLTHDATDIPANWSDAQNKPDIYVLKGKTYPGGLLTNKALTEISMLFTNNTVLNVHTPWTPSNLQIAQTAKKFNIPYIVTPHGSLDNWPMSQKKIKKTLYLHTFAKLLIKNATFMHYTAMSEKTQAEKRIASQDSIIIPCMFDCTPYKELPAKAIAATKFKQIIDNTKPNILFLSRLHPKKGADILIEASKILTGRGLNINVLIAGPDDYSLKRYHEQLHASITNESNIHFVGMVTGDEKLSLYQNADIFVLPTHQENFGLVLIESLACGTPVITSFGVDIWHEIQQAGAIIVENTPTDVANSIEKLLHLDDKELKSLGNKSREWVFSELDPEKIAKQYISMYSKAIEKSRNY